MCDPCVGIGTGTDADANAGGAGTAGKHCKEESAETMAPSECTGHHHRLVCVGYTAFHSLSFSMPVCVHWATNFFNYACHPVPSLLLPLPPLLSFTVSTRFFSLSLPQCSPLCSVPLSVPLSLALSLPPPPLLGSIILKHTFGITFDYIKCHLLAVVQDTNEAAVSVAAASFFFCVCCSRLLFDSGELTKWQVTRAAQ